MTQTSREEQSGVAPDFAFLTNHGKSLLLIAGDPRIRIRDVALLLGITERAAQRIVADLVRAGYIDREREGRRNLYTVRTDLPLGLPIQRDVDIGTLLAILPRDDAGDPIPE
jgi:DNA-binding MarR family transcriptional regulator